MATLNPELFTDPNLLRRVKERLDELQVALCDAERNVLLATVGDGTTAIRLAVAYIDRVLDELGDVRDVLVVPDKRPTLEEGKAGVILDMLG